MRHQQKITMVRHRLSFSVHRFNGMTMHAVFSLLNDGRSNRFKSRFSRGWFLVNLIIVCTCCTKYYFNQWSHCILHSSQTDTRLLPPTIIGCPRDFEVTTVSGNSAVITWPAVSAVTDNNQLAVVVSESHQSGNSFPLGTTRVILVFGHPNSPDLTAACMFTVTVCEYQMAFCLLKYHSTDHVVDWIFLSSLGGKPGLWSVYMNFSIWPILACEWIWRQQYQTAWCRSGNWAVDVLVSIYNI